MSEYCPCCEQTARERDAASAALGRCRSVLKSIEYNGDREPVQNMATCPCCEAIEGQGHRDNCELSAALKEDDNV